MKIEKKCYTNCINKSKCCSSKHWAFNIQFGGGKPQWTFLQHNGPMFNPPYVPHKVPVIINGHEVVLDELAEEYATMYARYIESEYASNNTFRKNFWKDFKLTIKNLNVESLDAIDFSPIKKYLDNEKSKRDNMTKEEKEALKKKQDALEEPYKFCIIDGVQQQVGNYKIEPPGIFIGRGSHPKIGHIKKRIMSEDVIINLSKDAKIPIINHNNQATTTKHNNQATKQATWKDVIHDQSVIWLASWKEEITGKNKYVFTSLDSFFKSKSDESKFNLAKSLKRKAGTIRETYEKQLTDPNIKNRQLATALYFIDNLALRVGGSKDTKEEADTVGVTSLRVEHLTFMEDNTIKLDFLGKDSVRYCKKVKVLADIYKNLIDFVKDKSRKDELFDLVNSSSLNEYLNSFLDGLTAKVWRTYNASLLFQKELDKVREEKVQEIDPNERLNYLIAMFNQANTSVALLCNHQKSTNNSLDKLLSKMDAKLKEMKKKKAKYVEKKNHIKAKAIEIKIKTLRLKKDTKLKMKNVSLGTSKNNYIDPRIIFSFIKKFDIPPEKLFTKVLIKRFEWAAIVDKNYRF